MGPGERSVLDGADGGLLLVADVEDEGVDAAGWDGDDNLVGGLYGINIGNNFFGESMFSLVPSASKLALIFLARTLEPLGGIIDCQFETPHLKSMGGRHITYEEYMEYLRYETEE